MRVLDLFSGIGGFSLALERAGMTTVAFCEYEEFPRKVLAKHWPNVPCYPDVRELTKEQLIRDKILADTEGRRPQGCEESTRSTEGAESRVCSEPAGGGDRIDLICGGYPCQPFSTAGKRGGQADDRHLWPEMYRLIETIRPRWVLAENVAGHISMGLDDVLSDLENAGYSWWTFVIPACAVDAKHRRDRVWIVANATIQSADGYAMPRVPCEDVADPFSERGRSRNAKRKHASDAGQPSIGQRYNAEGMGRWLPEPPVGRVAHGVSGRVDRLKSLGNAVVPQVVEVIGRAIMATEHPTPAHTGAHSSLRAGLYTNNAP